MTPSLASVSAARWTAAVAADYAAQGWRANSGDGCSARNLDTGRFCLVGVVLSATRFRRAIALRRLWPVPSSWDGLSQHGGGRVGGCSRRTRASGLAITLWFFFVLADLLCSAPWWRAAGRVGAAPPYLLLLNPADVFRILNIFGMEDVRTAYGRWCFTALASPWLLGGVMGFWVVMPLGVAL